MLRLHVFDTGWVTVKEKYLFVGGGEKERRLPVLAFVIEHPAGLVVFDTGLSSQVAHNPASYLGPLYNRLLPFRSLPDMDLPSQMRQRGLAPENVRTVILSHLHFDHTGGLRAFQNAEVKVSEVEWTAAQGRLTFVRGYKKQEYAGLPIQPIVYGGSPDADSRSSYDVMGDGQIVLVPTYGHTRGHQSLLLDLDSGLVLLAGDAVYCAENYTKPAAQPMADHGTAGWQSVVNIRGLWRAHPDILILPAHDALSLQNPRPDILVGPQWQWA
ncbi:MAG: N-acyl homoserine lactonase family protein [Chloroflexi bacterium]|nr:N-acyl homoserine lactonase family protein [Chloroflexota bacterium]